MKFILVFMVLMNLFSCTTSDPVGKSDFVIKNSRNMNIYYKYHLKDTNSYSGTINSMTSQTIQKDVLGPFGMHSKPDEIFIDIIIYSDAAKTVEIQKVDPIINSNWAQLTPTGKDYWEYSIYTLEIK